MTNPLRRRCSCTVLAALLAAAAAPAQLPGTPTAQDPVGQPATGTETLPGSLLRTDPFGGQGAASSQRPLQNPQDDGLQSIWSAPNMPAHRGFAVFPVRLQGYYPTAVGSGTGETGIGALPVPMLPTAPTPLPAWPAWVRTAQKRPLPFAVDRALLVSDVQRVWFRETADEAFVPLPFHDPFRTLQPGAEIEVRQNGQFGLVLHASTNCNAHGPTRVELVTLDEQQVRLRIPVLTSLRIEAASRHHVLELPDGSLLEFDGLPAVDDLAAPPPAANQGLGALFGATAPTSAGQLPEATRVTIERVDEPRWYGGRAQIHNLGGQSLTWRRGAEVVTIAPSQRATMLLTPPEGIAATLELEGMSVTRREHALELGTEGAAEAPHTVSWCGARIEVDGGATVRLEPLQGQLLGAGR